MIARSKLAAVALSELAHSVSGLYAGLVAAWLPLRLLTRDLLPPVTLLGNFLPLLLLPAFVLLPVELVRKRYRLAGCYAVGAAVWLALFVPRLLETEPAVPEHRGVRLEVQTWNLGHGRAAAEDVVRALLFAPADLVAVQESTPELEAAIREHLAELYPHQVFHDEGLDAKAVLSALPLLEVEDVQPEVGRGYQRVVIDVSGTPVTVFNVHGHVMTGLLGRYSHDDVNLSSIAAALDPDQPALVLGDFNLTEFSAQYEELERAGLRDAFREVGAGFGFTFPLFGRFHGLPLPPVLRLDYLWHTPALRALSVEIGADGGSDHLPLRAQFGLVSDTGADA